MRNRFISFIGGGNMARSLMSRLIVKGHTPGRIAVSNRGLEKREALAKEFGVISANTNALAAASADVLVIAVKPQFVELVSSEITAAVQLRKPLVISLAAGIRAEDLNRWLGGQVSVVRSMSNTPASVGEGMTALFANPFATPSDKEIAETFFQTAGQFFWVQKEEQIDTVTPLISCGPAYLFLAMEAIEQAAVKRGVDRAAAKAMALQMAYGAMQLAKTTGVPVDELRKRITTPNGVTEKSLNQLTRLGFFEAFDAAYGAAEERSRGLGASLSSRPRSKL